MTVEELVKQLQGVPQKLTVGTWDGDVKSVDLHFSKEGIVVGENEATELTIEFRD